MSPAKALIAVVGTTGVGKNALALRLASRFNACIINTDSMQVYKGLDLVTNKPDLEERNAVPHYLYDFVDPAQEYSVAEFSQDAIKVVDERLAHSQIPILVGGTNYYLQSLLWRDSIIPSESPGLANKTLDCHTAVDPELKSILLHILEETDPRLRDSAQMTEFCEKGILHETLMRIDPVMANKWHPSDYRKIRRSLEIYYTTGMTQSAWYSKQREDESNMLRYPVIMIWLYGKPDILDSRLDSRVDQMLHKGLLSEIEELRASIKDEKVIGTKSGYTRGVLQAIGFKEFHDYFQAVEDPTFNQDLTKSVFEKAVEDMKLATRQYARKQIHWIKRKLGPAILHEHEKNLAAMYVLDATGKLKLLIAEPEMLTEEKIEETIKLVESFIVGEPNQNSMIMAPHLSELFQISEKEEQWNLFYCEHCLDIKTSKPRAFTGQKIWLLHTASRAHKKALRFKNQARPAPGDKQAWLKLFPM